jgi:quercetin dioxygenase-like cupin family protein
MTPEVTTYISTLPSGQTQYASLNSFKDAGDEIPLHVHTYWHNCIVIAGSVEIYDDTGKSAIIKTGHFAEFKAGRRHAIKACEAGTITLHVNEPGVK